MKPTTTSILYGVKSDLEVVRAKIDAYMYGSEKPLPDEDLAYCRKVYDSICKTLDLL
jgi:chromosome condensin MukBEF MukE localization factor